MWTGAPPGCAARCWSLVNRLPPNLPPYAVPFPQYDPHVQGPFIFNPGPWAYEEMHVPPIPEPRAFRSVFNALRSYAAEPGDLRMIVGERDGRVKFHQGDRCWPLQGKWNHSRKIDTPDHGQHSHPPRD